MTTKPDAYVYKIYALQCVLTGVWGSLRDECQISEWQNSGDEGLFDFVALSSSLDGLWEEASSYYES